jgi:capsule polysaccharide export protein KpsE/RkpR
MAAAEYNLAKFLPLLYKWRWPLGSVTVAGFLVSLITSLLLPNIYRSTAIFYPTSLPALETNLNPEFTDQQQVELSMTSDDADRLISLGQSEPVLRHIIQKFNLAQHYGYPAQDTTDKIRQKVLEEFLYHYSIAQNNRSAVEISFDDTDKYFAARVANAIMQQIDTVNQQLTRLNQQKIVQLFAQRQKIVKLELQKMQDSLLVTRQQYNIFGSISSQTQDRPESHFLAERLVQTETNLQQAQATLKSYQAQLPSAQDKIITLKAEIKGLQAALQALKSKNAGSSINLESYLAGSDKVTRLETAFNMLQAEFQKARQNYEDARLTLTNNPTSLYVVQTATPAFKKVRPIRWLIVLGSTLLTLLLSVLVITILERRWSVRRETYYA